MLPHRSRSSLLFAALLLAGIGGLTATGSVRTVAGARVGMSFAEVDGLYHGRGHLIAGAQGRRAYVVHTGPLVLFFGDHPIRPGVGAIQAGLACVVLPPFRHSAAAA